MSRIFLFLVCAFSLIAHANQPIETSEAAETPHTTRQIEAVNLMSSVEKKVREAAVKIYTPRGGHGSGGLIKYKDLHLVLTAHHVADGPLGQDYYIAAPGETRRAVLVYKDPLHDISLLYLPAKFENYDSMKWKVLDSIAPVGHEINYSGFPSWHSLMSFRGHVAGYETIPEAGQQIILQTYGYFGSSGSVVYDNEGKIIGVLWGVDVQRDGIHKNIIWVAPIQNLNMDLALSALCNSVADNPKACR